MTRARRSRGLTILELMAAMVVVGFAMAIFVGILVAARKARNARAENAAAWSVTQETFERLRSVPVAELPGEVPKPLPLPVGGQKLREAVLTASCSQWKEQRDLRRLCVTLQWRSSSGKQRQVFIEGLVSDARQR